jgi:hypothetical protein
MVRPIDRHPFGAPRRMRPAIDRRLLIAAIAVTVAVIVLVGVASAGLLGLAPSALLGVLLLFGRFPGERVLAALVHRRLPRRRSSALGRSRPSQALLARGGRLVAARLAGRAPPVRPMPAR